MKAAQDRIVEPEKSLPVYGEFDLVVVGGGISGVAAAIAAAKAGQDVLLVEECAFLGREVTGSLRTHTSAPASGWGADVLGQLKSLNAFNDGCIDAPALTVLLDRLVQAAKVRVLLKTYCSEPIVGKRGVTGVVLTTKSGRCAALASKVIDATEEGYLAQAAGAKSRPIQPAGPDGEFAFLMALIEGNEVPASVTLPEKHPHQGKSAEVRRTLWPGECIVRFGVTNPKREAGRDPKAPMEVLGRELAIAFAAQLKASVPAFQKAVMTASAWRVLVRPVRQYAGLGMQAQEEALCDCADLSGKTRTIHASQLTPPGIEGLLVVSPAADIGPEAAEALFDFANAAALGEKAGALAARQAVVA